METINYNGNRSTLKFYDCLSSMANIQVPEVNSSNWASTSGYMSPESSMDWYGVSGSCGSQKGS